ncbi:benzoate/H(+) symporter BenE family transporter [Rhizobiales bacterium]|uniref:benzoate/H(+) symporter BenE family transporter n=1 Tax=Hongsoonwoonella zoysiae TaxID=2821844 RepID=UPI001560B932|nr:benzoate/H(+) symporter BenE family transporter [Hongsoonwoonella zoysiae]NRG18347.1 benzoate/H(+) symporter BenE family transporter [Hongsoonwoonella zoysiae]
MQQDIPDLAADNPRSPSWPTFSAGLLAAVVGFASSFAVVLQGLTSVGASPEQAASGLMALSISMGLGGIVLSLWHKMPISVAWSTPGAALLATAAAPAGGFPAAVGAFIVCACLIVASGLFKPFGRAVSAIPAPLANAMLAGVLLGLCLAPVEALANVPQLALPVILVWLVVSRINRLMAIPIAVVIAAVLIVMTTDGAKLDSTILSPEVLLIAPVFSLDAAVGIALPLFVVTMASQNIPGMAVLNANGYRPAPQRLFWSTGLFSFLSAPFGGHAVNLAAITAALCANPDADPNPKRRYWAVIFAGIFYCLFGLLAGMATSLATAAPPVLIEAVAGLALLGSLAAATSAALADEDMREAAIVTFLVTASGTSFFGVSGAFWGLLAGLGLLGLSRLKPALSALRKT